ncbi:MAG TPA: cache domain-containing protein [Campylobacterales bacterium]|nr:cache domain-containing protein [Campylobacterales bacterium]
MIVSLKKINRKIYTVLGVSIAFVSIILISAHAWYIKQNLQKQEAQQAARLKQAFFSITDSLSEFYRFRAAANTNSPGAIKAIKAKNTELLQELVSARWRALKQENKHLSIMQIHAADDSSILRLHEPSKFGDEIAKMRFIVKKTHDTHSEQSGIEKGKYGVAYMVVYPVFDRDEYIGAIEFGVSLEYIVDALAKLYDLPSSILVSKTLMQGASADGRFSSEEFVPLGVGAVNDQLLALKNKKQKESQKVSLNNRIYTMHTFELHTTTGDKAAKIAIAQDITEQYDHFHATLILSVILVVACGTVATIFLGKYLQNSVILVERARQNEKEQAIYLKTVLDSQQAIVIVTDGYELADANQKFFDFFESFKNMVDFKKSYNCICDLFIPCEGCLEKGADGLRWVDEVLSQSGKHFYAKMADARGEEHIFEVFATKTVLKGIDKIVVTFDDVTLSEKAKKLLEEKAAQEEMIAVQNSKLASMGEMMSLIAHQWRQPLNTLAIIVQDVKMAYQYNDINEAYIDEFVKKSILQINYMSKTIDDFRNFLKPGSKDGSFRAEESIRESIALIESAFKKNGVAIELYSNTDKIAIGNANEFKQAIINILKNAQDSIREVAAEGKITIEIEADDKEIIIKISDEGGGISDTSKLFTEYYTTKQENGTGLGLFMSKKIIEKMGGKVIGRNKEPQGAVFEITLRTEKKS